MSGAPRRIAIVGSRGYPRLDLVEALVARLATWGSKNARAVVIVSGTEPGGDRARDRVDERAIRSAREHDLGTLIYGAEWDRHDRAAGPIRNTKIVENSDALVAFWDLKSRGTADVVDKGLARGIVERVYLPDGTTLTADAIGEAVRAILPVRRGQGRLFGS